MLRLYRTLLKLFPAGFREEYASAMEQEFRDELAESPSFPRIVWLWMRLLFDLAVSIPRQVAIEALRDSKHAIRVWAKHPWQAGFAITVLAVAIGVCAGVFSVVNATLLRSLPFRDADRLAALVHFIPPHSSASQFENWRTNSTYLDDAALFEEGDFNIGNSDRVLHAHAAQTSWNFFSLLGVQAFAGRTFSKTDDNAAILSYSLWQALFAGSEKVVGSSVKFAGKAVTIVGVMPPDFDFPADTRVWLSAHYSAGNNGWGTIARLKTGLNWDQAQSAFVADVHRLEPHRAFRATWVPRLLPLRDRLAGRVKRASLLLLAGVLLILLIASANLANLMMARTIDRRHELSIRSAIGASRARIIQQLVTECLLLALTAAALGLVVACWAAWITAKAQPAALASQTYSVFDLRVIAFMIGLSLFSTILFGLVPALIVGHSHSFEARGSTELRRSRFVRHTLVAAQVGLCLILLAAAGSITRAFSHVLQVDRGFSAHGLVTVTVSLAGTRRQSPAEQSEYFREMLDRVRRIPFVQFASATQFLPLDAKAFLGGPYAVDGHPSKPGTATDIIPVMADYFAATGGKLISGRDISPAELQSDAAVAVVNDTFARLTLGTTDAVGHLVTDPDRRVRKIIGVVKRVDFMGQWISDAFDVDPPEVFVPEHDPSGFPSIVVVRVTGNPEQHVTAIRDNIQSIDRGVPVYDAQTMQQRLDRVFARPRLYQTALVFFAAFAFVLAIIGVHSVVSYAVTQRTHEMGIRLALGSTARRLRASFLVQGLVPVVLGATCGVAGAMSAGRLLASLIDGAMPPDSILCLGAVLSICGVAGLSLWVATSRIARLQLADILRAE